MYYGPDTWYGQEVSVLEMDGQFDKLEELIYVESHMSNTSAKFYGEAWAGAHCLGFECG
jgi:phosphoribulokinase